MRIHFLLKVLNRTRLVINYTGSGSFAAGGVLAQPLYSKDITNIATGVLPLKVTVAVTRKSDSAQVALQVIEFKINLQNGSEGYQIGVTSPTFSPANGTGSLAWGLNAAGDASSCEVDIVVPSAYPLATYDAAVTLQWAPLD